MFYQQGLVARSPAAHVSADTTCTTTMQREHAASCTSQRPKQEQVRNLAVFFSIFHWSTSRRALGAHRTSAHSRHSHLLFSRLSQLWAAGRCWQHDDSQGLSCPFHLQGCWEQFLLCHQLHSGVPEEMDPHNTVDKASRQSPTGEWDPRSSRQHCCHSCLTFSVQYHREVFTSAKTTRHLE